MDEDLDELIALLCTRLGIFIEDASAIALGVVALRNEQRRDAIDEIANAAAKIGALSEAIQSLSR